MMYEGYAALVSNVGFPIAAFTLMWHMSHKTIKENTEALRDLKTEVNRLRGER